jgi:putative oxidoreductase
MQAAWSITGRCFIALIFILSAVGNKIPQFNNVVESMRSEGVPVPAVMLVGAIVFLVAGGLSVVTGYKIQIGAGLLLVFLILATYFFHDFWNFEGEQAQQQMIQFMKNLSLMGTMMFLIANGSGAGGLSSIQPKAESTASAS